MRNRKNYGYSLIAALLALVVIALVVTSLLVYKHHKTTSSGTNNSTSSTNAQKTDPYAGWKMASSERAKFSIKYPSDWQYSQSVGDKDNVEHFRVYNSKFQINIDSFNGTDPANGGTTETRCTDCLTDISTETYSVPKFGTLSLDTVTYKLDNGSGNALILRMSNGTYYLPSPTASSVTSRFRGGSTLSSLQEYQSETPAQFKANQDYTTANKILKSLSY